MGQRRSSGEGTLFKRKDGRWSAQTYVTLPNGTTKRICITNRDRDVVKSKLREALDQEHRNIPYAEKNWTISEYLDYWMKDVHPNKVRESTLESYHTMIKCHIKPVLGGHKLKNLSVQDVCRALEDLKNNGRSGRTCQKCLAILSGCLTNAMREEIIFRNVARLVEKPKHTSKKTIIWTAEQAALFLDKSKDHSLYIAFLFLLTYGIRRGEILGLRWEDIDFENNLIHMRQQIGRVNGKIKAWELKTNNSTRPLPLIDAVRDALMDYAEKNGIVITKFNPHFEISMQGTIIVSSARTPVEPKQFERSFHRLREEAGLQRINPHAMRHTVATVLKEMGVPIKDVQLILGHASITTTLNIYQHGTPEIQRTALSTIGARLLGREPTPQPM